MFVELNSAFNRSNWFRYRGLRCAEEKRHWVEKLRQGKRGSGTDRGDRFSDVSTPRTATHYCIGRRRGRSAGTGRGTNALSSSRATYQRTDSGTPGSLEVSWYH